MLATQNKQINSKKTKSIIARELKAMHHNFEGVTTLTAGTHTSILKLKEIVKALEMLAEQEISQFNHEKTFSQKIENNNYISFL